MSRTAFVEQSGRITPNHIAKWVTNGVIGDAGLFTTVNAVLVTGVVVSEATRDIASVTLVPNDATALQTYGYHTLGDGGGALYTKTTGSTSGGFQSADGAWWQLATQEFYAEMFGAVGDGVTDDSTAIQTAHDFIHTTYGGGIVHLYGKDYAIATGLRFSWAVGLHGPVRAIATLTATAVINMFVWGAVEFFGDPGVSSVKNILFQGNTTALSGVVVGDTQNFLMENVHIEQCADGLVLCATQNSLFLDVFSQFCTSANLLFAGGAWNNTFIRFGSNQPGNAGHGILSRTNLTYLALCVSVPPGINNRHNTFFHPIIERGTPINQIRLEDDDGLNAFYEAEIQGGVTGAGTAQVYIGLACASVSFWSGDIQGGGQDFSIDNFGFGTNVYGMGVSGSWLTGARNTAPGTLALQYSGLSLVTDSRAIESSNGFVDGSLAYNICDFFHFTGSGSNGVLGGVPSLKCEGHVIPRTTNTESVGNSARRWASMYTQFLDASIYVAAPTAYLAPVAFASLPTPGLGAIAVVTNSSVNAWGGNADGAGAFNVLVWHNGTNWKVIGQ